MSINYKTDIIAIITKYKANDTYTWKQPKIYRISRTNL